MPTLHTDRLTLRPFATEDVTAFFNICKDERAMRFMPSPPHRSVEDTHTWLNDELSRDGTYFWTVTLKDTGQPIGHVNFLGGTRFPGMGYMLHPDYWGQGYTSEACRAALAYGFEHLAYDRMELWIDETNAASLQVARKLNFNLKGRIPQKYRHKKAHHFMLVYGLLAQEWFGKPASESSTSLFGVEPVLMVHDVAATALYYRNKLGFHIDFLYGDPADHASVSCGDWSGRTVTIQLTKVPPDRSLTPSGYLYIFTDSSLDALCELYRERAVDIVSEPEDKPWGMREFVIKDMNGHILMFGTQV